MPISEEDRERLRQKIEAAELMIPQAEADIRDALKAGLDVSEQSKALVETKAKLKKLKIVYGR